MRWLPRGLEVLLGVALALMLLWLPRPGSPPDVDCSWQGLLQLDWLNGARAGVDTVFTYGPAGFGLALSMFSPDGLATRFWMGVVLAAWLAYALVSFARLLPGRWRHAWLVVCLLVGGWLQFSAVYLAITALGLRALWTLGRASPGAGIGRRAQVDAIAMVLFYAMLAFVKFTYFVHCAIVVAVVCAALLAVRRWRGALVLGAGYALVLVVVWLLLGQRLGDLPAWWRGSREIATGYNEIQALYGHWSETALAVVLLAASGGLMLSLLARWWGRLRPAAAGAAPLGGALIVLLGSFLVWKASFVRHDAGHTLIFWGWATMLPFLVVAGLGVTQPGAAARAVTGGAVLLGGGLLIDNGIALRHGPSSVLASLGRLPDVLDPAGYLAQVRAGIAGAARGVGLERLRATVGDEPVDLMGNQQGRVLAAGFRVRHRPVFQGYSCYTPYLQQLNADFFTGGDAPRYCLVDVQASDGRLPMTEDSQAWKVIVDDYRPIDMQDGVLLCRRRPDPAPPVRRRVLDHDVALGQWVEVPSDGGDWHELGVEMSWSWLGRLVGALYRPPAMFLDVRTTGGHVSSHPVSPLLVRSTFLLDPLLRDNADLLAAWSGEAPARVAAFRLRIEEGREASVGNRLRVRLDARPASPVADGAERQALAGLGRRLRWPQFALLPFAVEPEGRASPHGSGGRNGVLAHAPCALLFHWPGGRRRLEATFEMAEGCWSGDHPTDGAVFRVEVGSQPREVAFERWLQPRTRPPDRGLHRLSVELDLPAGEVVALVTGTGPAGNVDCDWTCWRSVALDPP